MLAPASSEIFKPCFLWLHHSIKCEYSKYIVHHFRHISEMSDSYIWYLWGFWRTLLEFKMGGLTGREYSGGCWFKKKKENYGFGCCHAYFGRYFQVFKISDCIPVQWKLMETHFWCTQNWFFFWCPITSNNRQASRWKVFLGSISFQENQNLKTLINRRNVFRNKNIIQSVKGSPAVFLTN